MAVLSITDDEDVDQKRAARQRVKAARAADREASLKARRYYWRQNGRPATIAFCLAVGILPVATMLAIDSPFPAPASNSEQQIQDIIAQSGFMNEKTTKLYNDMKQRAVLAADASLPTTFDIKLPDCSTDPVEGAFCEISRQNQTEIKQAFLDQKAAYDAKMDAAALCLTQQTMGAALVCEMTEAQFNQMQVATVYAETTTIDIVKAAECLEVKSKGKKVKCDITQTMFDRIVADGKITQDEITTSISWIRPFNVAALEASGAKIIQGFSLETAETLRPSVTVEAKAFERAAKPAKKAKTTTKPAQNLDLSLKVAQPIDLMSPNP